IFGKYVGKIIDYLTIFFLFGLTVVMIAGGGSALYQGFGLPMWTGSLAIVILLFIVLQLRFNKIMTILSVVTPFLVIAVLVIAGYNIINPTIPFSEIEHYTKPSNTSSSIWWWDAIVYGGLIIGNSFSFLTIVGSDAMSHKTARRGSFYGGLSLCILFLIMTSGLLDNMHSYINVILMITCVLMANIQIDNSVDITTLLLANDIHPYIGIFMSAVMIGVIFNSCIGMLYPFLSRFTRPSSKGYVSLLTISLIVA